jgi:hypothetical protein
MSKSHDVPSGDQQTCASDGKAPVAARELTRREQIIAGLKMVAVAVLFLLAIWLFEH